MIDKDLIRYGFTKETNLSKTEKDEILKTNPHANIKESEMHFYLCEMDDLVNTRILLGIFKCVNFMKNVLVAGLVCGGIGVLILAISLIGK